MCTDIRKNAQFNELKLKAASLQIVEPQRLVFGKCSLKTKHKKRIIQGMQARHGKDFNM